MKVKDINWKEEKLFESDVLYSFNFDEERITVLDRLTGFGYRDVETGYRDSKNHFWLASGLIDIRNFPEKTIKQAIEHIKENANTLIDSPPDNYTKKGE